MKVEYDDTFDTITARVVDLKLTKEQNGTTLTCKFASMHTNVTECKSNAAIVHCEYLSVVVVVNRGINEFKNIKVD